MILKPAGLLSIYLKLMQFDLHNALMCNKLNKLSKNLIGDWLDVGAGNQPYRKFFRYAGKYLATNTRRHYQAEKLAEIEKFTDFWIEDGSSLPLPDSSLDGVACFQVLSVIEKPDDFFKEVNRVLKPEGFFLLTTDFLYPVWSSEDVRRVTATGISKFAQNNGFEVKSVESFGGFASTLYMLVMRHARSFPVIWKQKRLFPKILTSILYFSELLLIPVLSLLGMLIFLVEKRVTNNTDFTFNLMLIACKTDN